MYFLGCYYAAFPLDTFLSRAALYAQHFSFPELKLLTYTFVYVNMCQETYVYIIARKTRCVNHVYAAKDGGVIILVLSHMIRSLRRQHNLTQQQLSALVGVSVMSVRTWEAGTKSPSMSALIGLSKAFNVSVDSLLGTGHTTPAIIPVISRREQKLIDEFRSLDEFGKNAVEVICRAEKLRVNASEAARETAPFERFIPHFLEPSAAGVSFSIDSDAYEMIRVDGGLGINADFAVSISGDSMLPLIHNGEIVYVKRVEELNNWDVGVFSVNGEMFCKHYYQDNAGNVSLVSANPQRKDTNLYLDAQSMATFKCFGKVLLSERPVAPKYFKPGTD